MPAQPAGAPLSSADRALVVAVLIVAVLVRLAALWQLGAGLRNDPDAYSVIARNLVSGRGYSLSQGPAPAVPTAYRPPLFPCLLAVIRSGCGGDEQHIARVLGGIQLVMGSLTVLLTIGIARQLGLSRASIWAGLIVALDPLLVYGTTQVMTETTATFLTALTLWFAMRGTRVRDRLAAGGAFGLCCLCRPTFWAFGGLVFMAWLWQRWRAGDLGRPEVRSRTWKGAAAFAVATALVAFPWVARNQIVMGRPILTTTHGGYTLLLGHNPFYAEAVADKPWGTVWDSARDERWTGWIETELTAAGIPLERVSPDAELARDRWMTSQGWDYVRSNPGESLRCSLTLLGRMWNVTPFATKDRALPTGTRRAIGGFYLAVFAALAVGLWGFWRESSGRWWPVVLLIASFSAVHTLYWADMRMRAPLVPAIALLAARGVRLVAGRMKDEG